MSDLVLMPATRQLELLRSGAISIVELAEAHIEQIERLNPQLNVFADFDADRVRAQARQKDRQTVKRGPLHGLPVTVKSSIATKGYLCEMGSLLHKGEMPAEDALVVARLRAAGALILGTTNCPEFLMAYETANLLHGRTRNPWDLERTPGGSSGGESAAICGGGFPHAAWAATAAARCACRRTSPASARLSPRRGASPAAAICRRAWGHSRHWVLSVPWRALKPMLPCCFGRLAAKMPRIRPAPPLRCASRAWMNCAPTPSGFSKTTAWSR